MTLAHTGMADGRATGEKGALRRRLGRCLQDALRGAAPLVRSARSISFSQYGEDVLLSVTLLPRSTGFYVDVGAYHPWKGSNTYKLYLRGWSGITIEPNPQSASDFANARPRDKHVVAGVASEASALTYHRFADGRLNTFSKTQAKTYLDNGSESAGREAVSCLPLQDIIDRYAAGRPIDLLSVDCEGFDLLALETLDFGRTRPVAILIEDFEAFDAMYNNGSPSPIQRLMSSLDYSAVGQAVFSTLYVDRRALEARKSCAFDLAAVQF
jgi:FkbM family methyltransferase